MKEPEHYLTPILNLLYNSTLSHLNRFKESIDETKISKKARVQQFQIITLGSSRRMGHSQAVISLINDRKLKTVYICGTIAQGNLVKEFANRQLPGKEYSNIKVYCSRDNGLSSLISAELSCGDTDLIVIDDPTISQNKREQILDTVCGSKSDPIILRIQPKF